MRTLFFSQAACVLLLFLFSPIALAAEDAGSDMSIAVVDVQALLTRSDAAESLRKQLSARQDKIQAELKTHEKTLRDMEKDLKQKRESLTPDEYAKQRKAFDEKLLETRKLAQERKAAQDEAFGTGVKAIREEILQIVADLSEERGYHLVLSRQNVVLVSKSIDISDEVMKRLNAKMKTVDISVKDH